MKKFLLTLFIFIFPFYIYSQVIQYTVCKDSQAEYNKKTYPLPSGTIINWNSDEYKSFISFDSYENIFKVHLYYILNGNKVRLPVDDLSIVNSIQIFENKFIQLIPVYYLSILRGRQIDSLLSLEPQWKNFTSENLYDFGGTFKSSFRTETIVMSNLVFLINKENPYLFENVSFENNTYKINMIRPAEYEYIYNKPLPQTFRKYSNNKKISIILEFDGDYVDIWINSKNEYFGKYYAAPLETQNQIHNLVAAEMEEEPFDLTKVYWPRHADGSSDFDNEIKPPMVQLVETKKSSQTSLVSKDTNITNVSGTNVTVNKTMTTNCNLKLRSGEATSTQVLTVMSAGTKVKILELGKTETIDGINSNWVKVEVQSGAKDRDGKPIKAGTVGWCYGGYLE